jgi:hypothetical protein
MSKPPADCAKEKRAVGYSQSALMGKRTASQTMLETEWTLFEWTRREPVCIRLPQAVRAALLSPCSVYSFCAKVSRERGAFAEVFQYNYRDFSKGCNCMHAFAIECNHEGDGCSRSGSTSTRWGFFFMYRMVDALPSSRYFCWGLRVACPPLIDVRLTLVCQPVRCLHLRLLSV